MLLEACQSSTETNSFFVRESTSELTAIIFFLSMRSNVAIVVTKKKLLEVKNQCSLFGLWPYLRNEVQQVVRKVMVSSSMFHTVNELAKTTMEIVQFIDGDGACQDRCAITSKREFLCFYKKVTWDSQLVLNRKFLIQCLPQPFFSSTFTAAACCKTSLGFLHLALT